MVEIRCSCINVLYIKLDKEASHHRFHYRIHRVVSQHFQKVDYTNQELETHYTQSYMSLRTEAISYIMLCINNSRLLPDSSMMY